ncbi:NAD(P)-binding domain-containig protein (plasmid) [Rhizobium etli 8C-3]|uniref:NAD(P)-binding domain-containig protein n=1 Tax=Rhizobium etli 8C-3 TaxID=538025 RepID=A0A1L5PAI1_RHIET|nr:NAD(P)-binding domain-containig protein [Rhizobium etli 8C-3]
MKIGVSSASCNLDQPIVHELQVSRRGQRPSPSPALCPYTSEMLFMAGDRKIRVGIIGASTNSFAWASTAHVPGLKALPEYELVAVASRSQENADKAAAPARHPGRAC